MTLLVSTLARAENSAQGPSEYQVKAAFLYNFVKFVEWPPGAVEPREPMMLCVLGKNPFGDALATAIEGKSVNGQRIATRRVADLAAVQSCHVLFVSSSESGRVPEILRAVRPWNVLTVSEIARFLERGGMINFVMDGQRVRFHINAKAAADADLKISSKLLQLAAPTAENRGKN
jgi:hypothetical protein